MKVEKSIEPSLKASELRYRRLFEAAQDGILILDARTGMIADVNPYLIKLLGYSREEFIKKKLWEVGAFKDIGASQQAFEALQENEYSRYEDLPLRTKDGRLIQVEFVSNVYLVGDEKVIQCNIRDITARKRAEQEIASLAKFPSENPNPVLRLSQDGILLYANPASRALLELWGCALGDSAPQFWRDLITQAFVSMENKTVDIECNGKVYSMFVALVAESGYLTLYGSDITARKQAEEALQKEKDRAQQYLDIAGVIFVVLATDRKVILVNKKGCEILGYVEQEIVGRNWFDFLPQDEKDRTGDVLDQVIAGKIELVEYFENPVLTKSGHERLIAWHNSALNDKVGRIIGIVSSGEDITERKRTETERQALLQIMQGVSVTEDLHNLLELIRKSLAKVIYAENFFVVFQNKSNGLFEEVFAVDKYDSPMPPSKLERSITSYVFRTGESLLLTQSKFKEMLARGEVELVGAMPAIWLGAPLKTPNETIGVIVVQNYEDPNCYSERDKEFLTSISAQVALVIERKRAGEVLKESEERYRALVEQSPAVIYIDDPRQTDSLRFISQQIEALSGYSPQAWRADDQLWSNIIHPEDRERVLAEDIRTHKTGIPFNFDYRLVHRDGHLVWVHEEAILLRDASGQPTIWQGFMLDITERKQIEEKLKEERILLRTLIDNLPDRIFVKDVQGRKIISNNADWQASGGKTMEEVIGKTDMEIYPLELAKKFWAVDKEVIDFGVSIINHEEPGLDSQGNPVWVLSSKVPLRDGQGKISGLVGIGRDITGRKMAEGRIQRQLGRLTALSSIDRVISSNFDLKLSLSEILTHVTVELGVDAADIFILKPNSQILEYGAERGFRSNAIQKAHVRLGENYAGRAALERQLVKIPNLKVEPINSFLTTLLANEDFICYYGVPLIVKGQVKGVLEVFHRSALEADAEWSDFFYSLAGQAAIAIDNFQLFDNLQRSTDELELAYDATIEGWSHALDLRDKETEGHTQRVTDMTVKLARTFGLSEAELAQVRWGALLHDIGKLAVPDGILLKPGPLTDEEWVVMKKHPTFAHEMLAPIRYLRLALDIPYCHHEKWDGSGYPQGLKGAQIPLVARIFAVVDVWDALNSDRPYRAAWPEEKVLDHIRSLAGTHFDPQVVAEFMQFLNL